MNKKYAIGVDLGGTSIKYAIVREDGKIVWDNKKPTEGKSTTEKVMQNIVGAVEEAKAVASTQQLRITGVGLGTPGLVDIDKGVVRGGADNIVGWRNLPLSSMLYEATGLPAVVDNDANFMGLGEYTFGGHSKHRNVIFLTIGTGIGGAIILGGEVYRGYNYAGAELGALVMNYDNKTGFWEDFASTSAFVAKYAAQKASGTDASDINGEYIFQKYSEGELLARQVIDENANLIGQGIASYINIFNPEKVVIGGGVSEAGHEYIDKIKDVAMKYAMPNCSEGVIIEPAKLGNRAGFLGAAHFALSRIKE